MTPGGHPATRRYRSVFWVPLLLVFLSGCSWFPWFGGDDEPEEIKPNPLPEINEEVSVRTAWSRRIGDGAGDRAIRLRPAVSGGRLFAASADGNIMALTTDTGRIIWEVEVRDLYTEEEWIQGFSKDLDVITGGVGAGGDLVTVGLGSGEVLALNQSDGAMAWRSRSSSEVLAPPQVDRNLVVVQTIDGKVAGLDAISGDRLWLYNTTIPALTLRGTATPIIFDEIVVTAFANGRVAFLDRERGLARFDQRVAVAQGSSDLERLVDIDGTMAIEDGKLYAASFQGRIVSIDLASGRTVWADDASTVAGLGAGFGNVYLATADGLVTAFDADTGREVWSVDALFYRDITAPVPVGSYLAFIDFEGYLHLMAQSDGRFVGRRKVDGNGAKAGVVSAAGRLYVMGDGGTLSALEIQ